MVWGSSIFCLHGKNKFKKDNIDEYQLKTFIYRVQAHICASALLVKEAYWV